MSLKKAATNIGRWDIFFWVLKKGAQIWWTGTSARSKPPKGSVHCCLLASSSGVRELERWRWASLRPLCRAVPWQLSLRIRDCQYTPVEAQGQASLFETGTLHFPHARPGSSGTQNQGLAVEFRSNTFLASTFFLPISKACGCIFFSSQEGH